MLSSSFNCYIVGIDICSTTTYRTHLLHFDGNTFSICCIVDSAMCPQYKGNALLCFYGNIHTPLILFLLVFGICVYGVILAIC